MTGTGDPVILDRAGRMRAEHCGYDRSERVDAVIVECIRKLESECPS